MKKLLILLLLLPTIGYSAKIKTSRSKPTTPALAAITSELSKKQCTLCSKDFLDLIQHRKENHHECILCAEKSKTQLFAHDELLKTHLLQDHLFICAYPECPTSKFSNSHVLKNHLSSHLTEQKYAPFQKKGRKKNLTFKNHVSFTDQECLPKQAFYQCLDCNIAFTRHSSLYIHEKSRAHLEKIYLSHTSSV
ncbi:hypothetical protein EBU24_03800 [bacterium]|nr:hypothetical protein [bacterium]